MGDEKTICILLVVVVVLHAYSCGTSTNNNECPFPLVPGKYPPPPPVSHYMNVCLSTQVTHSLTHASRTMVRFATHAKMHATNDSYATSNTPKKSQTVT